MERFAHVTHAALARAWAIGTMRRMSDHRDDVPPSPQHREEEVVQHVLREVRTGRSLEEVLEDSYVVDRAEADTHLKVLDHPEVTETVGADIIARMRSMLDA